MKKLLAADLFCGAGGASHGLVRACRELGLDLELLAINHWPIAVETHQANHPGVRHLCEAVDKIDPRAVVPGGRLNLLLAGPECTHFSTARGGRPMNPQSRASAWNILKWAQELYIDTILIENVPEFRTWGPVGANGKPLKTGKGQTYKAFLDALRSLGYKVADRILCAADYGDPTTRKRLFIVAHRGQRSISWPNASHSPTGATSLFGATQRWKPARDIIDWSLKGKSVFNRKKPLKPNTMARILAGLEKFGGPELKPFLVILRNHAAGKSVDEPIPALCTGNHVGVAEPFLLTPTHGGRVNDLDAPMPTVTGARRGEIGVIEPFVMSAGGPTCPARPVSEPLGTVLTRDHRAVVEAFVLGQQSGSVPRSVSEPLPTVATDGAISVVEPFLVDATGAEDRSEDAARAKSVDEPVGTVTGSNRFGVAEPFLTKYYGSGDGATPANVPVPTVTTKDRFGLVEPFIFANRTNNAPKSIDAPVPSLCTGDHIALVQPVINGMTLDIRFRMLQPHELAAATSFPKDYQFKGTREEVVKQIGNAWPGELAKALCLEQIRPYAARGKKSPAWKAEKTA